MIKLEIGVGFEENIALHTFTAHSIGMLIGGILGNFDYFFDLKFSFCKVDYWVTYYIFIKERILLIYLRKAHST